MKTEKLLGGLGALFYVLVFVPFIGWVLGLIGLVFLLVALSAYSKFYKDSSIFNNFLIGFFMGIIGLVILLISGIGSLIRFFSDFSFSGFLYPLIGFYIFDILQSFFFRKSLISLSRHSGVNLFGLAGNFMLIGAVLTIIIVGLIIWFIGWILLAVAFFQHQNNSSAQCVE